jgi:uncharacterized protein DUF5047
VIELSDTAAAMFQRGNQRRFLRVDSWYDDMLAGEDLPITSGSEEVDRGSNVPELVTLTIPRRDRGVNYTPTEIDDPLAANGQRLHVQVGVAISLNQIEWLPRGWFVITDAQPRGDTIEVQAAGLLWLIQEARLISPIQPSGTFISTIRKLVEPALTVVFDSGLVDRAVPATMNYDEDRLGALNATLAAWPADMHVTEDGYLLVEPAADTAVTAVELTNGTGGTVITATGTSTRDGAYNAVVARGTTTDGGVVQGVAYDLSGPKRSGGPFNDLPVPLFYDSPLLTTPAQAQSAANTRLGNIMRQTSQTYEVEMVPHPALQAGDRVSLTNDEFSDVPAIIEKLKLPYLADGGSQSLTVRSLA